MERVPRKKQRVVALKYDAKNSSAPKIIGKGVGDLADRIINIAHENGIPLRQDPELVQILSQLDIGKEIPQELYQAVAEIMIFIYKMNQRKMKKFEEENAAAEEARRRQAARS